MAEHDALLAQLKIMNERSSTYGRQFWQVPFAYLAASGVIVAQLAGKEMPRALGIALLAIDIIGMFAVGHLCGLYKAAKRSFCGIKELEKALDLPTGQTKWKPFQLRTLLGLTILVMLAALAVGWLCFRLPVAPPLDC